MFFIFGVRNKSLAVHKTDQVCGACQAGQLHAVVVGKYFHICYVPFTPFVKEVRLVCSHCRGVRNEAELPAYADLFPKLKSQTPYPKTWFAGLALVAAIMIYGSINDRLHAGVAQESRAHPRINDVLIVKSKKFDPHVGYFLVRVEDVSDDAVTVSFAKLAYQEELDAERALDDASDRSPMAFIDERFRISTADFYKLESKYARHLGAEAASYVVPKKTETKTTDI